MHVYVSDQKAFWKNTVAGFLNNVRLRINKYRDCLSISPSHDKLYAHPSTKSRLKNFSLKRTQCLILSTNDKSLVSRENVFTS